MKNRKLNRLKEYDYSQNGYYFVTICTQKHNPFFGDIIDNDVLLNEIGTIAEKCLLEIPKHFSDIEIDCYVVMPNHVHLILIIDDGTICGKKDVGNDHGVGNADFIGNNADVGNADSVGNNHGCSLHRNMELLPKVISQYKSTVTRQIRKQFNNYEFAWQKSYYDHIIFSDKRLGIIRKYIYENPLNWQKDKYYPDLV